MPGYTNLTALLTRFPELVMIRKFDELSIRVLLYKQAELLYLEKDLEIYTKADNGDQDLGDIDACWMKLNQSFIRGDCDLQKTKFEEMQIKLKDYHETLIRIHRIQGLSRPSVRDRNSLRDWLDRKEGGNGFLNHIEVKPWLPSDDADLVSLREDKEDSLDRWLASTVAPMYHRFWGHRKQPDVEATSDMGPVWEYRLSAYSLLGRIACVLMSCAVPLVSIVALYYVHKTHVRLILISIFTVLFAVLVGFIAFSKRSDIFASTVAFAAVQVVFLQGINGYN